MTPLPYAPFWAFSYLAIASAEALAFIHDEVLIPFIFSGSSDHLIQNNGKLSEKLTQKSKRNNLSPDPLPPDCPDYSLSTCFVCEKSDRVLMKCSFIQCTKHYHADCINQYECSNQLKNICPLHTCLTCYREHSNNSMSRKGAMVTCIRCPTAFHSRETCIPAGSVEVDVSKIICPFHFVGKERNSHQKPCNVNYCSICGQGGELVCCEACPTSVHQNCLKTEIPSEDYYCEDCTKRKYLLYGMIVWGKFGKYRWWPGKIIHPSYLPENVKKLPHYDGEFAVQYYGTRDYSWMHSGRVYRYTELHKNCSAITVNKFGKYFELGLKEAAEAFDEYEKNHRNKRPEAYKHIQVNRALSPAQIFICDVNEMLQCSCDPSKANPCGLESECLNRSMLMECHPDVCKAKNLCQNQKFQRRQYASTKIFKTENCGWGLKTLQDVKKGEFVIEYVGEIITHEEYRRRYREKEESSNFYFLYLDSRRMIDAGPMGNYSRFINHSCGPNCEMIKWSVNGDARIGIFALRKIHAGEELTFNYQSGKYVKYEFEQKCLCSSVNCRGFIGEKNESSQKKPRKKSIKECEKAIKSRNAKVKPKNYVPVNKETKRLSYLSGKGCADHLTQNNGTSSEKPTRNSKKVKLSCDPLPRKCFLCKKIDADVSCLGVCSKFFHLTCLGMTNVPENFKCPGCSLRDEDILIQNNGTDFGKLTRNSKKVKLSCDPLPRECFLCKKSDADVSCPGVCSKFFHLTCLGKTNVPENFKCPDCTLRDADLLIQNNGTSSEKATRNTKKMKMPRNPLARKCVLCQKSDADVSCLGVCSRFFHLTCLGKTNVPENFKCPDCSLNADLLIQNNGTSSKKATRNSKKVKLSCDPLPSECFLCKKSDADVSCPGVCSKFFHLTCLGKTNVPENFKCPDCTLRDADLLIQNNGTSSEKATRNSKKLKMPRNPLSRECVLCQKSDADVSCLGVCSKFFHLTCLGKTNVPENFKCPDCSLRDADLLIQNNGTNSEKATRNSKKMKMPRNPLSRECVLCQKSDADVSCLGVCSKFFHLTCLGKTNVPENFKCPDCSLRDADLLIQNNGSSSEKATRNSKKVKLSCDPSPRECFLCKKNDADVSCLGVCSKFFHLTCLGMANVPENFKCPGCSLRDADLLIQNNGTSSEIATWNSKKMKMPRNPLARECVLCQKSDADVSCLGVCSKFFHLTCLGKTNVPENFKCPDCSLRDADLLIQNNGTSSEKAIHQSEKIKLSCDPLPRICFLCKKSEADISCLGVCSKFFHLSCLGKTNIPENFKCPDCSLRSADPVIQNGGTSSEKSNQMPEKIKLSRDPLPYVCDICKISDANIPYLGIGSKIFHLTCLDKSNLPENFKCPNCSLRDTDLLIQNNETCSEKATQSSKKNKLSRDPLPSVCDVCKKDDADISCLGICSKFFHLACLGKTSVPENFKCPDCSISDNTCFVCEKSNGYLVQCSFINCTKHYHTYCINQYECTNQTENICPLHTCLTCYRENSNNPLSHTGAMVTCIRCPTSFHSDETCIPAGSVEVEMSKIICSLHFVGNERISPRKSCNVNYCIICGQDGDLVCCKACPTSVHQSCLKIPNSSEDYTCNDCLERKYLLYGMIVWGKFGSFRWWPAQIIHPSYLPNNVKKQAHYDGEFVIRYFGTHDYSWTHKGRVYPYTESHKNYPRTKINKFREEFEIGLEEAAKAFDEYEENCQIVGLLGKRHKAYKHLRCLVKFSGSGSKSSVYKTTIPKPSASSVLHPVQSGKMPDNLVLTPIVRLTRIDLLNSFEHSSINIASLKLNEIGKEKKNFLSLMRKNQTIIVLAVEILELLSYVIKRGVIELFI
ncbi:histone-lysine N-methyltransferase, H3 lysine-36 specific [Trichonephila clavata]|uniref:Histone-lysine N-methyltransferase, H3 lysine-36 specific n=1 Tax=Trichonephila clavata TaxID=2740835 RepID=A0A8X6HGU4_TRICU|nr:histone-lysine N-methyltransferase, H3 lysine-36 specific [Trichonephila clavata]